MFDVNLGYVRSLELGRLTTLVDAQDGGPDGRIKVAQALEQSSDGHHVVRPLMKMWGSGVPIGFCRFAAVLVEHDTEGV